MKTESGFLALIGDVSGSREVANRADLQARLERELARLNARHGSLMAAPLTISAGDEFMALLPWPGAQAEGGRSTAELPAGTSLTVRISEPVTVVVEK